MRKVVFVQGGGLGLDQEQAVRRLFEAARVPVEFEVHTAGRAALEQTLEALPQSTFDAVRTCGVALKTKLLQPKGAGTPTAHGPAVPTNYNVAFRRKLGLFASVRPVHNLPGISSRFSGVDFLLVREITEDLYTASEHEIVDRSHGREGRGWLALEMRVDRDGDVALERLRDGTVLSRIAGRVNRSRPRPPSTSPVWPSSPDFSIPSS